MFSLLTCHNNQEEVSLYVHSPCDDVDQVSFVSVVLNSVFVVLILDGVVSPEELKSKNIEAKIHNVMYHDRSDLEQSISRTLIPYYIIF